MNSKPLLFAMILAGISLQAWAETIYTANENGASLSVITWPAGSSIEVPIPDMPHNVDIAGTSRLLMATGMSGNLLIFNSALLKKGPLKTIYVGNHPAHVISDKTGKTAYVTLSGEDAVAVVDLDAGKVVKKIPVGAYPHGLRLSPDGSEFYVANMRDETVSVISIAECTETARIKVGKKPVQVAVVPDGKTVYVSLNGENAIAAIDSIAHKVVKKIAVGQGPVQLVVTEGRLFVANQGNEKEPGTSVTVINLVKKIPITEIRVRKGPHGIAVSSDGKMVFVTDLYADEVSVIDAESLKILRTIAVGKNPNGITVLP